jgi:hypothetical protein
MFFLGQEDGVNAWSYPSSFRKDLGARAALAKYLRNDEGDSHRVLDLRMDAWLLEDLFQEEERLKGTRNGAHGYGGIDFAREDGELAVNRVSLLK